MTNILIGAPAAVPDAVADAEALRLAAVRRYAILDTPPEGAFDRVCAVAARVFGAPMATVAFVDADRIWFKAAVGPAAGTQLDRIPGLAASAILADGPYVVVDAAADPRTSAHPLVVGDAGLRFYAAAPIVTANGHRLGTLDVGDTVPRQVTDADLATLTDLAAVIAHELELRLAVLDQAAIERRAFDLVDAERRRAQAIATTLGRSLLPTRLPTVANLDTDAFYQPLSADSIGGDFYDLFPIDDRGGWGVFLGDVCGKGLHAAAVTSLIRYTLRAVSIIEPDPVDVLTHLHRTLTLDLDTDDHNYCTAAYATLRAHRGGWQLHLAVGGHTPPILIRASGAVEAIEVAGPAIGLFPDVDRDAFTTALVRLDPGDTIVFYTDGITDLRHADGWLGTEGLIEHLHGRPTTATRAVEALRNLAAGIGRPRDDIAVLALSVPGH